jgi:hypothetical protein
MSRSFVDSFRRIVAVWSTGAVAELDALCTEDLRYHMQPHPDMGREAIQQFIGAFHASFPDFQVTVDEDQAIGDTSFHRWTIHGGFTGAMPLPHVPLTSRAGQLSGCHIVRWRDGRAAEVWHYGDWLGCLQQDWLGCLQQAGVLPVLAVGAAR